eukprot:CAMPEP_0117663586 /NCGR_PEP_ID=MMETSP0804-20121206/8703_1 /TAXON_ID=1074897 /ORGANISM="Tetraselmis astigmatica, Strain CCMP880" /LENGTH=668 /DNA_ID=CAMNT_0005470637 /DNA_START=306 /DNA_END=2312 /DNA_ORIENTATION=+
MKARVAKPEEVSPADSPEIPLQGTVPNPTATSAAPRISRADSLQGDTASFSRPYPHMGVEAELPFCLYLPAMDGQGLTANSQFQRMSTAFDFRMLQLSANDRSSWEKLVAISLDYITEQLSASPPQRPVYLVGDSWGALIALGIALKCPRVHRIVLINPATVEDHGPLSRLVQAAAPALTLTGLPAPLLRSIPVALAPVLGNPQKLAQRWIKPTSQPAGIVTGVMEAAAALVTQADALAESLPPGTLDWRLRMMRTASSALKPNLSQLEQRVLIVAGGEDHLLPSSEEAVRLEKVFQRGSVRILPEAGHSLLQECDIDLLSIMQEEGFYVKVRQFTSPPSASDAGNNYGKAGPLELPTRAELDRSFDQQYKILADLTSPVFFSEAEDGSVQQGLSNVYAGTDRPILLIGNHQLMGLDMSFMVRQFLVERGRLMRGLAHPLIFAEGPKSSNSGGPMAGMRATFTSFGSVPVGATALFRLLKQKEMVLLFPGGAREALKKRGEKYQLIWPQQAEFVRMAAKFGAVIVPFGAIGSEDSLQYIMDSQEVIDNPQVLRTLFGSNSDEIVKALSQTQARRGVNANAVDDYMVPPIVAPSVPSRFYYYFRKPIVLSLEDANDREKCNEIYRAVKADVQDSIAYLIENRENDPYRDFVKRVVYEGLSKEQAPTFTP